MNIIQELEQEQAAALAAKRPVPDFAAGDTVRVNVKVVEGERERIQAYEGVCIGRSGAGVNESFTVRKISYGEGVERVFPVHSPLIESIVVVRRGRVRRAKLYYLRGRRGKSARIPEKVVARGKAVGKAKATPTVTGFERPPGEGDDLTRIAGIDAALAARLDGFGLIKFEQIADFSDEDMTRLDEALGLDGRIERDDWIGEARRLIAEAAAAAMPAEDADETAAPAQDKG